MRPLLARFAPSPGAPAAVVRRVGARNALLGGLLFVFGVLVVLSLDRMTRGALLDPDAVKPSRLRAVSGLPVVLGFVAMVVGLYRALTGIHPERDGTSVVARAGRLLVLTALAAALLATMVVALLGLLGPRALL